jgi:hypothetical protein
VFLLVPLALVLVAMPFVHMARQDDWGIIDDTRAYFGAGTAVGAPKVTEVRCSKQSYGTCRRGHAEWACRLYFDPVREEVAAACAVMAAAGFWMVGRPEQFDAPYMFELVLVLTVCGALGAPAALIVVGVA